MKLLLGKNQQAISVEGLTAAFVNPLQSHHDKNIVNMGMAMVLKAKLMEVFDLGEKTNRHAKDLEQAVKIVVSSPVICENLYVETRGNETFLMVESAERPIELKYDDVVIDRFELARSKNSYDYQRAGEEKDIRATITRQALLLASITKRSPEQLVEMNPDLGKVVNAELSKAGQLPSTAMA